jgi:hypothetical protein
MHRLLALALLLLGCKSEPPKPGLRVALDQLCADKSEPDARYTVEGYIAAPKMMVCSSEDCSLNLYRTQAMDGDWISVSFAVGDDANQMSKLPEKFTPADVKLHTTDGKTLGIGAKVRVTAKRLGSPGEGCQLIKTDLIEAT